MPINIAAISKLLPARSRLALIIFTLLFAFIWLFPPQYLYFLKGLSSYLPLHMLMETFAIIVAAMIFAVGWEAYIKEKSGNIVVIATVFLSVMFIDFAHMLSFAGMPIFVTPSDPEKAIFFWLCGRFFVAFGMLYIAINTWKPLKSYMSHYLVLAVSLLVTAIIYWIGLWHQDILPHTFIPGHGLTPLKIYLEWSVVAILALAAIFLVKNMLAKKQEYDAENILMAIHLMILSEIFFMLYADVADLYNFMGHVYKVAAYYYLYRAIFAENIQKPYRELENTNVTVSDLYNNAPCGYHSLDKDGAFIRINDTELSWLGYTRDEVVGKMRFSDILTPKSLEIFKENFPGFKERGWVKDLEFDLIRRDGTIFPVLASATAIKDSNGSYLMSRSTIYDITERKWAEQELHDKERHSQSLLRLSKNLELAQTYMQVLDAARDEVREILWYQNLWVFLFTEDKKHAHALFAGGSMSEVIMSEEGAGTLTIEGDRMLEEIAGSKAIVVVEDARTDPRTNKEVVARMGNRTIVNVPIIFLDKHLGSVGTGTFGDEGIHIPTKSEEEYLRALASHMAVTIDRIHLLSERKKAEKEIRKLNRIYRMLSDCNQSLIRADDENRLIAEICRIITEEGGYRMAWVGYKLDDEDKTIKPVAYAGYEEEYLSQMRFSWGDNQYGHGPTGTAIRTRQPCMNPDFTKDISFTPWKEDALKRGYASSVAFPLIIDGESMGVLNIYGFVPEAFDEGEIMLLQELASDLAFGIATIRTRKDRELAEKHIVKINRLYRILSTGNESLVRARDENELISNTCKIIVDEGGYRLVWVGYSQNDEDKTIKPVAYAGYEEGYLTQMRFSWGDNPYGYSACGVAIRDNRYHVIPDFSADTTITPWKEEAMKRGYASNVAFPLVVNGKPIGALIIYGSVPKAFNQDEILLLGELASDLAYGIATLRTRIGREHTQTMLNEAQRITHIGSWELDLTTNILTWSDEIYRMFEIDSAKFGASYEAFLDAIHPDDREAVNFAYTNSLKAKLPYSIGHRLLFPDGRIKYVHEQCETYYDKDGKPLRSVGTVQDVTERKLDEEALRHLSQRNELILNSAGEGIYGTDVEGNITFVNPAAAKMFGFPIKELIGKNSHQVFHHTKADGHPYPISECPLYKSLKEGGVHRGEEEVFWTKTGQKFEVEHINTPLMEEGKVVGAVVAFRDITERKRVQEALRLAYAYNRSLIEASLDPLVTISLDGKITDVNVATEVVTGHSRGELVGTDFLDYFSEPEKAKAGYHQVFETGFVKDYSLEIRHKDGHLTPVIYNASVYRDEEGKITGVFAAARDVAELRKTEEHLQEQLTFTVALNRMAEAVAVHADPQDIFEKMVSIIGETLSVDRTLIYNIDFSADQVIGLCEWLNPNLSYLTPTKATYSRQLFLKGSELMWESRHWQESHKDKPLPDLIEDGSAKVLHEDMNIQSLLWYPFAFRPDGYYLLVFNQVSSKRLWADEELEFTKTTANQVEIALQKINSLIELKQAEEALKHLNEGLETKVKERTAQLEVTNKELEAFTYSVSHDLRAPLRIIDGFSAAVMEDYGDKVGEDGKDYLQRVRNASQKMSILIDDLLSLSRLTRGELNKTSINLGHIASEVIKTLRESDLNRDVDVSIAENLADEADPHFIEIALTNLLNNAWKFTSKKEKAKIEFSFIEKDGKKVYYIKDNGAGFDMNYLGKMFQPFQRLHTEEEFPGTGIGLATVYRIIKKHGGDIWAEGEIGKGATFYFTLPAA